MENSIKTINYKEQEIKIYFDDLAESPINDCYFLGEIVCLHRNYNIGHSHSLDVEDIKEIYENDNEYISLPVFMYEHSGITINTTGYSCHWDSGQIGIIYVSKELVRHEYKVRRISKKLLNTVITILEGEIDTLDTYLTGQIFGYDNGDDSCWGYYDMESCIADAKSTIDYRIKSTIKNHIEKVKQYIKNNVPLIYRQPLTF